MADGTGIPLTYAEARRRFEDLLFLEENCYWRDGKVPEWVANSTAVRNGAAPVLYAVIAWRDVAIAFAAEIDDAKASPYDADGRWFNTR